MGVAGIVDRILLDHRSHGARMYIYAWLVMYCYTGTNDDVNWIKYSP
jgi:hypothetical protein